jgi:hypothetical protein
VGRFLRLGALSFALRLGVKLVGKELLNAKAQTQNLKRKERNQATTKHLEMYLYNRRDSVNFSAHVVRSFEHNPGQVCDHFPARTFS